MSEEGNSIEKQKGAQVIFRKFVEHYETDLKLLKENEPGQFISKVCEWIPALLHYYDESPNADYSVGILKDLLSDAMGNRDRSLAIMDGIYNACLRVNKKEMSESTFEEYKYFFESRKVIYENKKDEIFYIGNDTPSAIYNYDGSLQAEMAIGIVKKTIKEVGEVGNDEMLESFVYGLLVRVMVVEDYPKFLRWSDEN